MEAERDALLAAQQVVAPAPAAMLLDIKGVGPEFAVILWSEGLFRQFDNRRQIASYAGLAPTPWQSGSVDRKQGVSKAGIRDCEPRHELTPDGMELHHAGAEARSIAVKVALRSAWIPDPLPQGAADRIRRTPPLCRAPGNRVSGEPENHCSPKPSNHFCNKIRPGRTRAFWRKCARWCCRQLSVMVGLRRGSLTTRAFPSRDGTRLAWRGNTAVNLASRTIVRSRYRCHHASLPAAYQLYLPKSGQEIAPAAARRACPKLARMGAPCDGLVRGADLA